MRKRELRFDSLHVRGTIDDLHNRLSLYFEDETVMYVVLEFIKALEEDDLRSAVLRDYSELLKAQWRDVE